ncbi:hypothetical protein [Novipirellula caenicola]|uniref:Uncharacterized protein n=1 Tax=Novipirellula caenicola TaxID=1536901 RepID=A0ABP9VY99_9BACT
MGAADKLRDESMQYQAAKRDLLKWKLILTGTVSAFGLGFTQSTVPHAHLALCVVPLIAVYCDLLIRDYDLRIAIKGFFVVRYDVEGYAEYEQFINSSPISPLKWWLFSDVAISWTSLLLCVFVAAVGGGYGMVTPLHDSVSWVALPAMALIGAGLIVAVHVVFKRKHRAMHKAAKEGVRAQELSVKTVHSSKSFK